MPQAVIFWSWNVGILHYSCQEGNGLNIQSQRSGFDQYRLYKFESAVTGEFHDRWDAVNRNLWKSWCLSVMLIFGEWGSNPWTQSLLVFMPQMPRGTFLNWKKHSSKGSFKSFFREGLCASVRKWSSRALWTGQGINFLCTERLHSWTEPWLQCLLNTWHQQ